MHDRSILLVEDNPDDEVLTRRALAKNNIQNEILLARDGAEALDWLFGTGAHAGGAAMPELVLLDLKLPKVDGLEVLRRIRANPRTRLLPVVILTSSREEKDVVTGYGLGANSYIRKPVGYVPTENVGRHVFEFVHPDDRPGALELFAELMQEPGRLVRTELRALHKDGSWRRLQVVGVNRLSEPAIRAIVVTYRDITERERTERDLRETLSLLNATFESTADGILVVDLEGHIVSFNRKFAELWRIPDSILETKNALETMAFVLEQLADPQGFLTKERDLYARPDASSFDVLTFKDGRIFERFSQPQRIGEKSVGRVWSF